MNSETVPRADGEQQTPSVSKSQIWTLVAVVVLVGGILAAVSFTNRTLSKNMNIMGFRGWQIYITLGLGMGGGPKSGEKLEAGKDISEMRFENSSDYFSVLLDGEHMNTPDWSPYVESLSYWGLAGAGVPAKEGAGRLTAENNAWTIAANITDDMPDIIPVLITRNVDPTSLIPGAGALSAQRIRPSARFKTPLGNRGFVIIRKGVGVFRGKFGSSDRLDIIYQGQDTQDIRAALQKIEYLAP